MANSALAAMTTDKPTEDDSLAESLWIEPIEGGNYQLRYVDYSTSKFRNSNKLQVCFQIVGSQYAGRQVKRFYNIDVTKGGRWKPAKGGHLLRELITVFGEECKSIRADRIPLAKLFHDRLVLGTVVMCKKDANNEDVPEGAQTPKVEKLLSKIDRNDGNPSFPCPTQPHSSLPNHPLPTPSHPTLVEETVETAGDAYATSDSSKPSQQLYGNGKRTANAETEPEPGSIEWYEDIWAVSDDTPS